MSIKTNKMDDPNWKELLTNHRLEAAARWVKGVGTETDRLHATSIISCVASESRAMQVACLSPDTEHARKKRLFRLLKQLVPQGLRRTVIVRDPDDITSVAGYFTPLEAEADKFAAETSDRVMALDDILKGTHELQSIESIRNRGFSYQVFCSNMTCGKFEAGACMLVGAPKFIAKFCREWYPIDYKAALVEFKSKGLNIDDLNNTLDLILEVLQSRADTWGVDVEKSDCEMRFAELYPLRILFALRRKEIRTEPLETVIVIKFKASNSVPLEHNYR